MRDSRAAKCSAILVLVLGLVGVLAPSAFAQTTYTWNKTASNSWTTAANWTPTRTTPASNDILIFNGASTPTCIITSVPQETIGRLRFVGNVNATLSASAAVTLTISGTTNPALDLTTGSTVTLAGSGSTPITLSLGSSSTGLITGSLIFTSQPHVLTSPVAGAIQFSSPGAFTAGTSFSGSPFGTSGTTGVVVFNSGSTYTNLAGNGPWGLTAPNSRVTFASGSRQVWRATAGFQTSGRTFANLFVQNNIALSAAGSASFIVDTVNVESGSSFTHTGSSSASVTILGDILSAGTGGVSITPGSAGIQFIGGKLQTIAGGGTGAVTFGGNATIGSTTTLAISRTLTFSTGGMTVNGAFQFNQAGVISGGGTWVYGAGAALKFAQTSGSFGVLSSSTWWPAANGPANVTVPAAGITMNAGATRTIGGSLVTSGPITGANLLTIAGTLQLNTGGSVSAAPIYSGTATLLYNAPFTVGVEWGAGTVVGTGVPSNVTLVAGAGTLTMPNTDRTVPGNLTITSGTMLMNAAAGNLAIGGNWIDNGTFTVNGRSVTFTGALTQTLTRAAGETFATLLLNKTGGSVQLGGNVTCTPSGSNPALTFNGTTDILNLNGATLTLNGPVSGTDANATLSGSSTSNLALASTLGGSAGTLKFTAGAQSLGAFTVNLSGASGAVTLGTPVTVNGALTLTAGIVTTGANVLGVAASGSVVRTAGWVNGALSRRATTGTPPLSYAIGSATTFLPVSLTFTNVTVAGDVSARTTNGDHPSIATSGLVTSKTVNRYWTLGNAGATFGSIDATFNFVAGDLDAGVLTDSVEVREFAASAWSGPATGTRTATSTIATGLTTLGDFAIGEPITWTLTSSAGSGGTISPLGAVTIKDRRSFTFTAVPDFASDVANYVVDGVTQPAAPTFTFTSVTTSHTIVVNFAVRHFTLTLLTSGNGSLSASPPGPYTYHQVVVVSATPAIGNVFTSYSRDVNVGFDPIGFPVDSDMVVQGNFQRLPLQYTRSSLAGAYTAISTASGASRLFTTADDSSLTVPLPFNFTFSGVTYSPSNFLAVNANGFAYFSRAPVAESSPSLATNGNMFNASTPNAVLAPWYDDLSVGAVGTNPAGSVLYQTQGAAGSRTFTVQWTNVSSNNSTAGGQPRRINFQLVMFEASQAVEFRYGTVAGATYSNFESASLGVEDSIGGLGYFIDGITGSKSTTNGMLTTNRWPSRFIRFTPGVPAPLAAGTYTVGSGQNYANLTDAVADLNQRGVSGPVTMQLSAANFDTSAAGGSNQFPILIGPISGTSATNTVTLQSAGSAVIASRGCEAGNCGTQSLATAISAANEPVVGFVGCDWVTLKKVSIAGGNLVDRGVLLLPSSLSDGSQNNTLHTVSVTLNRTNTQSIGIQSAVPTTPSSAAGTNSSNHYYNLSVQNCYAGVSIAGNTNQFDDGNVIGIADGGSTVIGGAGATDIGNGTPSTFGIRASNQSNVSITSCTVRNVVGTSLGSVDGIALDNPASLTTPSGTCVIAGNTVGGLGNTATNAGRVAGIRANMTSDPTSSTQIYDNFVLNLNSASTTTVTRRVIGILVQDQGSGTGATHNVDFNSIRLQPTSVACTNSCFEVASIGPIVNSRDNVFVNATGTQTGSAKHYLWVSPASGQLGAPGSTSDYNVLYLVSATNGFTGLSGGDRALLSDWQAITAADAHSLSSDPQFVSANDLHINTGLPTPVAQAGSMMGGAISWVTNDIDLETRNASTPDIGADEGLFQVLTSNDIASASLIDPFDGATKNAGAAFSPQAQFSNTGTSAQSNIPVRYQIRGPLPSSSLVYDQGTTIAALAPGGSQTQAFPAVTIPTPGAYEIRAIAALVGDQNTLNDMKIGTLDVSGPLNGTYSIGPAQLYPFNTLTNALGRIGTVGVTGPVVFQLVASSYGASEIFPINLNTIPNASAVNTFTLRPAPGVTATVTGSTTRALIVLNGADFVRIDGSNTVNGTTRDLTFLNTSSTGGALLWGQTTPAGDPATNNIIKNVVLQGFDRNATLVGVGFGGSTIALKSAGTANNVNNRIENCDVRRVQYAITSTGVSAASKNTGTVITRNVADNNTTDAPGLGGIYVRFEDGISIDHNKIGSITSGSDMPVFGISLGLTHIGSDTWTEDEVTNATVGYNTIAGVSQSNGTGYAAGGIVVADASSGTTTIFNNMITGVVSPAYDPDLTVGILVGGGGATTRVYFNSVSMTGSRGSSGAGSFCLAIGGTNPIVDVRDNVFFTSQTSTGPGDAYLIGLAYASPFTNLTSDYNDCFGTAGQFGINGGFANSPDGDFPLIADWQTGTGEDAHSLSVDPQFVSNANNLHISSLGSPVVRAGTPLAAVSDDIDGDTGLRSSQPEMGCDEFVTYTISTSQTGSGSVAKSPDLNGYVSGSVVQMQAFPSGNWHFVSWGGDLSGTVNPQNITVNSNKSISATFAPDSFTVTVTAITGGTAAISPLQSKYFLGTPVTLTATAVNGYHFTTWTGDTTTAQNPLSIVVTRNRTLEADFAINTYTVTATGVANGSVTRTPNQATYDHGSTVRLTPVPSTGYSFASWTGDTTGTANPLDVVVTRNRSIQANFVINNYTLAINVTGSGTVAKSPDQPLYPAGTLVTLTATPAANYHLVGWSGDTTATTNPLPLPMIANRSLTATFALNQYTVTVTSLGAGNAVVAPVQALYNHGTSVTFTATPLSGQSFTGWTGDTTTATNPLTMIARRPLALVARFTAAVNLTIVGNGAVAKSPNLTAYPLGSLVTLTANPATGWHFVGWSGDTAAVTNPLTISLPTSRNLTATFAINTYTLQLQSVGNGSAVAAPQQATYDHGTIVQLTATPNAGNTFVGWSGDASGSTSPFALTMNANKVVTATFTWKLAVTSVGLGAVNISPNQANYNPGTSVTLTAQPQANVHFVGWTGDTTSATSPLGLVMNRNWTLTGTFAINTHTLNVTVVGSGSVVKNPDLAAYDHGTPVTLTATPATGFHFIGWSGDTTSAANPFTFSMVANRNLTATFAINTYLLTVSAGTGGSAVKSPIQATYNYGTQVTLTATPSVGYHFGSWTGDTASSDNPLVFRMVADRNVSAAFVLNQYPLTTDPIGNGTVTRNPDLPVYSHFTPVTLTAVASPGWHFSAWTGDTSATTNPLNITMLGPRVITPNFDFDGFILTVNVTGVGTVLKSPDLPFYPTNTTVDLTAVPGIGFKFTSWGGAASGTSPTTSIVMNAGKTVSAAFDSADYTVSATASGPGSVGWSPVKPTYRYPQLVTFTATPSAHAHFVGWTGDTTSAANPLTLVMMSNRSMTGLFALDTFPVDVTASGNGTVLRNPDLAAYNYGSTVTLTASPSAGWHFTSWTGDTTAIVNPLNVVVTRARSISAVFDLTVYPLTVNTVGSGAVSRDPDLAVYPEGTVVTLSAAPTPGWQFVNWSGDAAGPTDFVLVTMNGPRSVTATFSQQSFTLSMTTVGSGTVTKTPNQATYIYGTAVKLTAAASDTAHHFQRWGGVADGIKDTTTIIVRGNSTATGTFISNLYAINVVIEGTGVVGKLPNLPQAYNGSNVWMMATPSSGYQLEGWHGDLVSAGVYNPILFRADSNITVIARFVAAPPPTMNVTIVGGGSVSRSPDSTAYTPGTSCVLTATPFAGYSFIGWSGDLVLSENPMTVFMDRDKHLTATFGPNTFLLSTPIVGAGTVARTPNQSSFSPGTPVQVTATALAGSHFVNWAGDTSASSPTLDVTMVRDRMLQAQFGHTFTPGNSARGRIDASPPGLLYVQGATVVLTPRPVSGWHFVSWSGDTTATTASLPVLMWKDKSISAVYAPNRVGLSLRAEEGGTVTKSPDSLTYTYGAHVTITAIPAPAYHFSTWSQGGRDFENVQNPEVCEPCDSPHKNPLSIAMLSDRTIFATFELDAFSLGLVANGAGAVSATYVPQEGPDSTVVLSAEAQPGWTFARWEGDATGGDNPLRLKLAGPTEIRATFIPAAGAGAAPIAPVLPAVLGLAPVSPNPAVGHARFAYSLPREERVRIDVLDVQGRQVGRVLEGMMSAGLHQAEWAGPQGPGAPRTGMYFVRMKSEDGVLTRRFALTR